MSANKNKIAVLPSHYLQLFNSKWRTGKRWHACEFCLKDNPLQSHIEQGESTGGF